QVAAGNLAVLPVGSLAGGCRIILRGGWRRLLLRRAGRRGLRLARRRRRSDADWLGLDVARRLRRVMHAPLGVGPFVDLLRPGAAEAEEEKTSDDGDAHGDAPRFSLLLPGRLCVSLGADKVKPITPRRFPGREPQSAVACLDLRHADNGLDALRPTARRQRRPSTTLTTYTSKHMRHIISILV